MKKELLELVARYRELGSEFIPAAAIERIAADPEWEDPIDRIVALIRFAYADDIEDTAAENSTDLVTLLDELDGQGMLDSYLVLDILDVAMGTRPQVGDLVAHRWNDSLDYRSVVRKDQDSIFLGVGDGEIGPFPWFQYKVVRKAQEA